MPDAPRAQPDRYTAVAILLHWAIAAGLAANLLLGWWMHEAIEKSATRAQAFAGYQLHKSIGLTVLALTLVRLGWRIAHPAPALPEAMQAWEKFAARAVHWAFYALMLAIPLSGWVYISTQWREDAPFTLESTWFGLFRIPLLFGLPDAPQDVRAGVSETAMQAHELLAWAMVALAALHVAAALKHHFVDRDAVLSHMVPGLRPGVREPRRTMALALGFAAIALAAILGAAAFFNAPRPSVAPPAAAVIEREASAPTAAAPEPAAPVEEEAPVPAWTIDADASRIGFTASLSGAAAPGRFNAWRGDIRFDPERPELTRAQIVFDMQAATIDAPDLQASMMSAEGFDVENHPSARFRLRELRHRGGEAYEARGTLTLKGRDLRIVAPATLRVRGDRAELNARFTIRRDEADIGMQSDATFEILDRDIAVDVVLAATRAP